MDISDAIAILAVLVGLVGYWLNRRAIADEGRDRRRSLDLLEKQVQGDELARAAARAAVLKAEPGPVHGRERDVMYEVKIINAGPATAEDIRYRVVADEASEVASGDIATVLMADEQRVGEIYVPRARYESLLLYVVWLDGSGGHEEALCRLQQL